MECIGNVQQQQAVGKENQLEILGVGNAVGEYKSSTDGRNSRMDSGVAQDGLAVQNFCASPHALTVSTRVHM